MKLSLSVLALLTTLVVAGKSGKGKKGKKGKGTLPEGAEEAWREKHDLRDDCVPILQTIEPGADSFFINGGENDGIEIEMNTLLPMATLFAEGAMIIIGGVEQVPTVYVYKSEAHDDIRVVLDDDMNFVSASMDLPNGHLIDLIRVDGSVFAEYDSETCIDYSKYDGYVAGDVVDPEPNRALRGIPAMKRNLQTAVSPPNPDCAVIANTTMYIIADSDFAAAASSCDFCNGDNQASAAIQTIFAAVKDIYLNDACIDISLAGFTIAVAGNDPYKEIRTTSTTICVDSNSLEAKFRDYLNNASNSPPQGNAGTTHLFYSGPADSSNTIGCAYTGAFCGTSRYGVNQMDFSKNLAQNRNLLAHENGHNYNAGHTATGGTANIMQPSLNQAPGFSSVSVNQMQACVNPGGACGGAANCATFEFPPTTGTEPTTATTGTEPTTTGTDPTTAGTDPTTAGTVPTTGATTASPNTCLAYEPKNCRDTEHKVKRCCATEEFDCKGKVKLLCTGREEKGSSNDADEDEDEEGPDEEDEEEPTCSSMAPSCDNKVKKFKHCCGTTTMECPRKGKKGKKGKKGSNQSEPELKEEEICIAVLV